MVAGLVAVTTAVGTAVTTQQLIGRSSETLYLTTSTTAGTPTAPATTGRPTIRPTPRLTPSPPAATRPAATPTRPKATTSPPAPRRTKAPARARETERPAARERAASRSGPATGTGRIRYGVTYTGRATFYAATGAGNCSYEAGGDLMVAAMNQTDYENSQACGAHVQVTGPRGTRVTVRIVDRCPECPPGAIDLSRQAFTRLAPASAGRIAIRWKLLSPTSLGRVAYVYKSGSTRYWCGIQVRNHRNPVRSLQVRAGGAWKTLQRQEYNYFLSADGAGCGGDIRVTDIYGNRITDTGIRLSAGTVQRGRAQFGPPA